MVYAPSLSKVVPLSGTSRSIRRSLLGTNLHSISCLKAIAFDSSTSTHLEVRNNENSLLSGKFPGVKVTDLYWIFVFDSQSLSARRQFRSRSANVAGDVRPGSVRSTRTRCRADRLSEAVFGERRRDRPGTVGSTEAARFSRNARGPGACCAPGRVTGGVGKRTTKAERRFSTSLRGGRACD